MFFKVIQVFARICFFPDTVWQRSRHVAKSELVVVTTLDDTKSLVQCIMRINAITKSVVRTSKSVSDKT